ncbi:polyprenol monophosphomannose synthase [Calidifontibacter indicus]|uniref:Dolichol-phosphate mannosyltransferase n=1 Tax=Calidifontibacter indicus TaxID=419650 RepID=A0A3D9UPA9_9MICO|nr:polyprenol monophosphomannose synthase [Calidifontibacter indicus]REF31167.1 dolichol-phosphate mannosyltransferase [Calidifontibacter indicus]
MSDTAREPLDRVLVLLPTYNELENLPLIMERIRAAVPDADVLVLDDNSPDGTGELADKMAADDPRVQVLHRTGKEGLGKAYLAGFAWGLERGYDALIEIDADGSHPPEVLPRMLEVAGEADLVIGSRWVPGGAIVNWPKSREIISRGGNLYIRLALGMPVKDATAGYRVYRASALRTMGLGDVSSQGYCFQVDLTWRAVRQGLVVAEVPITFVERQIGASKMDESIVREAMLNVTQWGLAHRVDQVKRLVGRR